MTDVLLAIETRIAGADVVELNPDRDINSMTAILAAKMVKELAALATEFPAIPPRHRDRLRARAMSRRLVEGLRRTQCQPLHHRLAAVPLPVPGRSVTRPAAAPPPRPAPSDRAGSAPPCRARLRGRRHGRRAGARRRSPTGPARRSARASARRNWVSPDWRVPRISPAPRSRRSSSAMRKPSLVSRIRVRRARAVSVRAFAAQQQADAVLIAAPDPAAQLVELGEAEAVGMLDDHQRSHSARRRRPRSPWSRPARRPRRAGRRAITASFSGPFIRPWTTPTLSPKRCRSSCARSSAAARSLVSLSSTSGQTQ